MTDDDIKPFRNLIAAVIRFAINDACLVPIRGVGKEPPTIRSESLSAVEFLWGGGCAGYCAAIGINSNEMCRRIEKLSEDRSGLTIGSFNATDRRALRFNLSEWRRLGFSEQNHFEVSDDDWDFDSATA